VASFYAFPFPGDIYWHCNCKPLREKTLAFKLQKIDNCTFVGFMLIAVKVWNEKRGLAIYTQRYVKSLTSCSSCFVFTKHPVVQLIDETFWKYVLFKKGTVIKRAGVRTPWKPPWIRPCNTLCGDLYYTIRYDRWSALENWQASCQFNPAQ